MILDANKSESISSKEHEHTNKNFRLYNQLVVKMTKLWSTGNEFNYKDILSLYIETLLTYHSSFKADENNGKQYLDQLLGALTNHKYHSFIQVMLLYNTIDKASVKEDLHLDSLELQMFEHIVLQ